MSLRIRMQPVDVNVNPDTGSDFTVVHAGAVSIETRGSGDPPVQDTATPAQLEFYEVARRGDTSRSPRLLATLAGELRMDGSTPKFDVRIHRLSHETLVEDSDFRVRLNLDTANFENPFPTNNLFLPWEVTEERLTIEVGVKLLVNGAVHADLSANDRLDIPLQHNGVPEDGVDTNVPLTCFGVGIVYPSGNHLLTNTQRIAIGGNTLNVKIHDSVRAECNRIHAGSFDLADLTQKITTAIQSGGFSSVAVSEVDDAAAAAVWVRRGGRWVGQNVTDPTLVGDTEGSDIPFFDYWVFFERGVQPLGGDAGNSESFNPSWNPGPTKLLILPVVLPGAGASPPFRESYTATFAADRMNFLADVITHEVGHSLGLRHGVHFNAQAQTYSLNNAVLKGTMTMLRINGGHIPLKKFSPVHRDTIQRHFL